LYSKIVLKTPKETLLLLLTDTCCSGSMFDLPYDWLNNLKMSRRNDEIPCTAIGISACLDNQADNCVITDKCGFGGALTCFILETQLIKTLLLERRLDRFNNSVKEIEKLRKKVQTCSQTLVISSSKIK
jgi:hypothetical protein